MNKQEEEALLADVAEDFAPKKKKGCSAREERIIAGFEDIQRFRRDRGRRPVNRAGGDIFERLLAVRLSALVKSEECRQLLQSRDYQGLLLAENPSEEELLAELEITGSSGDDLSQLTHIRPYSPPDFVADRQPCADFKHFAPLFAAVHQDLQTGRRRALPFKKGKRRSKDEEDLWLRIEQGDFFILNGQLAYVAEVGVSFENQSGHHNARLRVIFDNRTESALLSRSLQRALYRDCNGRRISYPQDAPGPLFASAATPELPVDNQSGTLYVLRSLSPHPTIAHQRQLIHKIGVTSGEVKKRITNAENDATFLLAPVQLVAEYKLHHINPQRLEKLLHRIFAAVRLDIEINDRFGHSVRPQEWFQVPLALIEEAVAHIQDGSITHLRYDPQTARFVETPEA